MFLEAAESKALHAQLFHFFVVVLAVEDVPFLTAFKNGSFLAFDFQPGRLVDPGFLIQQVFKDFAHFQPDCVAVLDKTIDSKRILINRLTHKPI